MPGRHELSGRVLDEQAKECEDTMKAHVSGRFATGQCDGWKDTCKSAIIAFMMNVEYVPWLVNTVDVSRCAKDANNLLNLVLDELKYAADSLKITVVAWCTDASGESAKMRRLLAEKFTWMVVLDCWAHQINLIVGDMLKVKDYETLVDDALEVAKWFNNHSLALGMLRATTWEKLGKELSLVLPVITRWTSHYLCVRRLLELERPMQQLLLDSRERLLLCAGKKRAAKDKAQQIIAILRNHQFWDSLRSVLKHLEPLARAANITQGDAARLDIVLVTLANLYHYYSSQPGLVRDAADAVLESLERRWAQADQDVFILALVLNPYIRTACFSPQSPFRTVAHIRAMAEATFKRFYGVDPGMEFGKELVDYLSKKGWWSNERMNLKHRKEQAKKEGVEVDLVRLWREWSPISEDDDDNTPTDIPATGAGKLALLAMRIFSMVPNSTSVERIFSLFGFVHTKHRNRLSKDKVQKQVLVRVDTERQFPGSTRSKRKFSAALDDEDEDDSGLGFPEMAPAPAPATDSSTAIEQIDMDDDGAEDAAAEPTPTPPPELDFMSTFREMLAAADEDTDSDRAEISVTAVARNSEDRLLKNMFRFPRQNNTEEVPHRATRILTHYWALGERNLEREAAFQDQAFTAAAARSHSTSQAS